MATLLQIAIGAFVAWGISSYMDWDFFLTAAVVAVVWLWFTHRTPAAAGGGAAPAGGGFLNWLTNTVTRIFGSVEHFVGTALVFLALMLIVGKISGVSPYWVIQRFIRMGLPWNWGADTGLPVLVFVCEAFLAAGIAYTAVHGNWKLAGLIFGVSGIMFFVMMSMPETFKAVRPIPAGGPAKPIPGRNQTWADGDQSVAERGAIPVITDTAVRVGFGKPDPNHGVVGGGVKRFWVWAFGPPAPRAPRTTSSSAPAPRAVVPTAPPEDPEYPRSGEGYTTKEVGLKCWLDPRHTYTRPSGPARYVVANHPSMFFDDVEGTKVQVNTTWQGMPAGKYIVYPISRDDEIFFRWWQ